MGQMKRVLMIAALFMAFLIITIPIVVAQQLADQDVPLINPDVNALAQGQGTGTTLAGESLSPLEQTGQNLDQVYAQYQAKKDAVEKCKEKADDSDSKLEFMDNGVIRTIEGVLNIARTICITLGAIDSIMSTIGEIIGFLGPDSACCNAGWLSIGIACGKEWAIYTKWEAFYGQAKIICCWVTCGWCTGGCYGLGSIFKGKEGGGNTGTGADLGNKPVADSTVRDNSPAASPTPDSVSDIQAAAIITPPELGQPQSPFVQTSQSSQEANIAGLATKDTGNIPLSSQTFSGGGEGKPTSLYGAGKGVNSLGLSPYENIYTAIACLCPGAILDRKSVV